MRSTEGLASLAKGWSIAVAVDQATPSLGNFSHEKLNFSWDEVHEVGP